MFKGSLYIRTICLLISTKNDTTNLPREVKNNLRNLVQHITYKLALLNTRELLEEEREKHEQELINIIENDKEFLRENNLLVKDAVLDFGKLVYRCENDKEIEYCNLTNEFIEKIDDEIKSVFETLIDETEGELINKIHKSIQKLLKFKYEYFVNKVESK